MPTEDEIRRQLATPPEIYTSDPKRERTIQVRIDGSGSTSEGGQITRIPFPTPTLKRWLSGKSTTITDKSVAMATDLTPHRVGCLRHGVLAQSWEAQRLAKYFAYPVDYLNILLFVYARKRLQEKLGSITMQGVTQGYVLAIVPVETAKKHRYPTFEFKPEGRSKYGLGRNHGLGTNLERADD